MEARGKAIRINSLAKIRESTCYQRIEAVLMRNRCREEAQLIRLAMKRSLIGCKRSRSSTRKVF